jgi:ornithine cyclodeaminase/alanine dehydrogenase-like protein (mu-crystallin family)
MLFLSEKVVEALVSVDMVIESAVEAYSAISDRRANIPLRAEIHRKSPDGIMLVMPGLIDDTIGVKVGASVVSEQDPNKRHTTVMLLVWDALTLRPRGLISGDQLNEHRTAGGFAAATRALARPDSRTHVIFGAGKLGFVSALYIATVLPLRRIILCNRTQQRAEGLAARIRDDDRFAQIEVITDVRPDDAVAAADVITTVTRSDSPVFDGRLVRAGTHINLGGANKPHQREMDDGAAARATFWLDSEEGCQARGGDIIIPLASGTISRSQIKGEIGLTLLGRLEGRSAETQITVFKSLGVATQDLVLASNILTIAERRGIGHEIDHVDDRTGINP